MLSSLRSAHVVKNERTLVNTIEGSDIEADDLRNAYFACLNKIQNDKFHFKLDSSEFYLGFDHKDPMIAEFLKKLMEVSTITPDHAFSAEEVKPIENGILQGLELLAKYDSDISKTIPMLVGCILLGKERNSVSSSLW